MAGRARDRVWLGAQAVATRLRLGALMRARPLPEVLAAITPRTTRAVALPAVESALAASERLIEGLRVVPDTCLYRALARYSVLRGAGHPARFVMGLQPGDEITGHAWVELDGEPAFETLDADLRVTYAYPSILRTARERSETNDE
jgi:hypothetical protein